MIGEQLQAMRDRMDNQFIDSVEESDEFELEDKPKENAIGYVDFKRAYYSKLSNLYYIQSHAGEKTSLNRAEENYEVCIKDLKEYAISKKYPYYIETLGFAHACKDYLDGEA